MRSWLTLTIVLLAADVRADPLPRLEPMAGPFATLADACTAIEHRLGGESSDGSIRSVARCRLLDDDGAHRVLVTDVATISAHDAGAPRQPSRSYALAIRASSAWWVPARDAQLDLTGNAWGAGHCCSGAAGTPHYYIGTVRAPGVDGDAIVLRTELPIWRVWRHGWQENHAEGSDTDPGQPHTRVGDYLICGTRTDDTPACYAFEAAHCVPPQTSALRVTADELATSCTR